MMQTKHNWTKEEILAIYNKPMMELLFDAATVHRANHNPNQVQVSTLLSIKTGGCPEDCGYCPQAARYHTDIEGNDLMSVSQVKAQALRAKSSGSSRVCMGAAWRNVKDGPEFDMRENGGFQPLGRQEGKDDVPAMLAKNEFVMTADAVRAAGGGSIQKGAQRMYDTMKKLESRVV